VAPLAVPGLLAPGRTGGGKPPANAAPASSPDAPVGTAGSALPPISSSTPRSQIRDLTPDVTGRAEQASNTLAHRMPPAIRSFPLGPGVNGPPIQQLAYVEDAVQQGNRLGAEALFDAWR